MRPWLRTIGDGALLGVIAIFGGIGCFTERDPPIIIDDDDNDTGMCSQAPCTTTGDPAPTTGTSGEVDTSGTTAGPPADSSDSADVTSSGDSSSSSDGDSSSDTGPVATCGDGEVNQDNEMCDSTPGCADDCTFEDYACNPLNNAACVEGLRCGSADAAAETFACMPPGAAQLGEPCSGLPNNDSDCDTGLTCLFNFNTPLCDSSNCCVEYCDITDPTFRCSGTAVCRQFFLAPEGQGLEHLGFCGEP